MSSFDHLKQINQSESVGGQAYDKILAIYNGESINKNASSRSGKAAVILKNSVGFEESLAGMPSGIYKTAAGSDLSNILYPFKTQYGNAIGSGVSAMPSFNAYATSGQYPTTSSISQKSLLPFRFDINASGYLYKLSRIVASGDAMSSLVSANSYCGKTTEYRGISDIRGIGLRLPMMAVGAGYTTDGYPVPASGDLPINSGNISFADLKFKGGYTNIYEVDPNDYIAAPIDLRYDPQKHVWTGPKGFWAELTGSSGVYVTTSGIFPGDGSGIITAYSWVENMPGDHGELSRPRYARAGSFTKYPAIEANLSDSIASGSKVYLQVKDLEDRYYFTVGGAGDAGLPTGLYQYQSYQMVSQNTADWDFIRLHPVIT